MPQEKIPPIPWALKVLFHNRDLFFAGLKVRIFNINKLSRDFFKNHIIIPLMCFPS